MDTQDLAALVPDLMASHPRHAWALVSAGGPGRDLRLDLHLLDLPERVASVAVFAGAELYFCDFSGHSSIDYAYDDVDRRDALQGRIELAVAATIGPTRVVLELAGHRLVGSRMTLDPDGTDPVEDTVVGRPLRRLAARFRRTRIEPKVIDFPRVP